MTKPFIAIGFKIKTQDGGEQSVILNLADAESLRGGIGEALLDAEDNKEVDVSGRKTHQWVLYILPLDGESFPGVVIPSGQSNTASLDYLEGLACPSPVT